MQVLRQLIRFILESSESSNPYRVGNNRRAPGLGWGTGLGGGFNLARRSSGMSGAFGGSTIKSNPIKPYSDDFSDHLANERNTQWKIALNHFEDTVKDFILKVKITGSVDEINELVVDFLKTTDPDLMAGLLPDLGMYRTYIKNKNVEKVRNMILANIGFWQKRVVDSAKNLDYDTDSLEIYTSEDRL